MRILFYSLLAILWPALNCFCQNPPTHIRPLSIGDKIPNITFNNIINYPSPSAKPSDFKGKLVILDFWATWCTACIGHFPAIDTLSKQFKNAAAIFLINSKSTGDSRDKIEQFYSRYYWLHKKRLELPTVAGDTTAELLFPHSAIPHVVWIYDGKLIAVTTGEALTAATIKKVLLGNTAFFANQKMPDYNRHKPLFEQKDSTIHSKVAYSSIFTSYLDGVAFMLITDDIGRDSTRRICLTNASFIELYRYAWEFYPPINQVIVEREGEGSLKENKFSAQWCKTHRWTYEQTTHAIPKRSARAKMQLDLKHFFDIDAKRETKTLPCWILIQESKKDNLYAKDGLSDNNLSEPFENKKIIQNGSIEVFVNYCNQYLDIPLVDETGIKAKVNLSFQWKNPKDIAALQTALQPYGLCLKKSYRSFDTLTIF